MALRTERMRESYRLSTKYELINLYVQLIHGLLLRKQLRTVCGK